MSSTLLVCGHVSQARFQLIEHPHTGPAPPAGEAALPLIDLISLDDSAPRPAAAPVDPFAPSAGAAEAADPFAALGPPPVAPAAAAGPTASAGAGLNEAKVTQVKVGLMYRSHSSKTPPRCFLSLRACGPVTTRTSSSLPASGAHPKGGNPPRTRRWRRARAARLCAHGCRGEAF